MLYIVTVPLLGKPFFVHSAAEAFQLACAFIRSGLKDGLAISNGSSKRIEAAELAKACESGELTF
jgi:hypothetical protein